MSGNEQNFRFSAGTEAALDLNMKHDEKLRNEKYAADALENFFSELNQKLKSVNSTGNKYTPDQFENTVLGIESDLKNNKISRKEAEVKVKEMLLDDENIRYVDHTSSDMFVLLRYLVKQG